MSSVGLNINTSQSNAFLVDLIMKKKKDTGTLFKFETSVFNDVNTLNSKCTNRNDLICSSNCIYITNLLRIFPESKYDVVKRNHDRKFYIELSRNKFYDPSFKFWFSNLMFGLWRKFGSDIFVFIITD